MGNRSLLASSLHVLCKSHVSLEIFPSRRLSININIYCQSVNFKLLILAKCFVL